MLSQMPRSAVTLEQPRTLQRIYATYVGATHCVTLCLASVLPFLGMCVRVRHLQLHTFGTLLVASALN